MWHRNLEIRRVLRNVINNGSDHRLWCERSIGFGVGNAKTTTEIHSAPLLASKQFGIENHHSGGRLEETFEGKNLRSNVRVQPHQREPWHRGNLSRQGGDLGKGQTELLILTSGG